MERVTYSPKSYKKRVSRLFAWEFTWAPGATAWGGSHMFSTLCSLETSLIFSAFLSFPTAGTIVLDLGEVGFQSHCLAGKGGHYLNASEGIMFLGTWWNPDSILPWHHWWTHLLPASVECSVRFLLTRFTPSEVFRFHQDVCSHCHTHLVEMQPGSSEHWNISFLCSLQWAELG